MIIDFGQNYIAESCHCLLLLEDIFMRERIAADVQKNSRAITSLSWRLPWLPLPKSKPSVFGWEETYTIMGFPAKAKVFSWDQRFPHNSTIMSCLQFQALKSFFLLWSDGGNWWWCVCLFQIWNRQNKSLWPAFGKAVSGLLLGMCFSLAVHICTFYLKWLFPLRVWTLWKLDSPGARSQIPCHLGHHAVMAGV